MENAVYLYLYFFEAFILWHYSTSLFSKKRSSLCTTLSLTICYLVLWLLSFLKNPYLNLSMFFLTTFLFIILNFSIHWILALFHCVVLTLSMDLAELLGAFIYSHFVPDYWQTWFHAVNLLFLGTLCKTGYLLFSLLLIHLQQKNKAAQHLDRSSLLLGIITLCIVCVTFALYFVGLNVPMTSHTESIIIIAVLLLILVLFLIFALHNYVQTKDKELMELRLHKQKEENDVSYYHILAEQNENQRILVHDIKNHLQSIALLNQAGDSRQMDSYIQQLLNSPSLQRSVQLSDHKLLNLILYRYQQLGKEAGINFYADIRKHTVDFLTEDEVTAVFCNLLDNAFESARQMTNGYIDIRMETREVPALTILTMVNSCLTPPVSSHSGFFISSKKDASAHGLGMRSIARITQKYGGDLQSSYNDKDQSFHTIITFPRRYSGEN